MDRNINKEALKTTMTKIWNPKGWLQFNEVGHNRYLVEFQKVMDKERVLNIRPWSFDKNLVCIQEFSTTIPPAELVFTHEPIWIQ